MKFWKMTVSGIVLALTIPVAFQNCAKSVSNPSHGNGEGYNGVRGYYVNLTLDSPCADGSSIRSAIQLSEDRQSAQLLRDDCRDISPKSVDVGALKLMPHNLENLVNDGRVYELQSGSSAHSALFCRTVSPIPYLSGCAGGTGPCSGGGGNPATYDVVVLASPSANGWSYSAVVKRGYYNAMENLYEADTFEYDQVFADHTFNGSETRIDQPAFSVEDAVAFSIMPPPSGSSGSSGQSSFILNIGASQDQLTGYFRWSPVFPNMSDPPVHDPMEAFSSTLSCFAP